MKTCDMFVRVAKNVKVHLLKIVYTTWTVNPWKMRVLQI
jgi:hypothetical protein